MSTRFKELTKQHVQATGELDTTLPLLQKYQTFGTPSALKSQISTLKRERDDFSGKFTTVQKQYRQACTAIDGDTATGVPGFKKELTQANQERKQKNIKLGFDSYK